jgi:hypothetical protein
VYPEQTWFNIVQVTEALTAQLALDAETGQRFHVQTTLLFKASWTSDRVAESVT